MKNHYMKILCLHASIITVFLAAFSYSYTWDTISVDSNLRLSNKVNVDLALDTNNTPHVAYFENSDNDAHWSLVHACNRDGRWNTTVIEQNNFNIATYNPKVSIAVGGNDVVYVTYSDDSGKIVYRKKQNGSWSSKFNIDTAVSLIQDIAVDNNGIIHILYTKYEPPATYDDSALIHYTPGSHTEIDTHGNFQSASIALDSRSIPHSCYYDDFNEVLKYAAKNTGSWTVQEITSAEGLSSYIWGAASIATDLNDSPRVSYYHFTDNALRYAKKISGSWQSRIIDANNISGERSSIAIDSNGKAHILYTQEASGKIMLKYAVGSYAEFTIETVTDFNGVRSFPVIALDDYDTPHIAYTVYYRNAIEHGIPEFCGSLYRMFPEGDADKNCFVDLFDLSLIVSKWLDTGCSAPDYCGGADLDESSVVNINDFGELTDAWLDCSLTDCF